MLVAVALVFVLGVGACARPDDDEVRAQGVARIVAQPREVESAVTATFVSAVALYHQLAPSQDSFVFSPVAISLSLAMAAQGASDETRSQLDAVMGIDTPDGASSPYAGLGTLWHELAERGGERRSDTRLGRVDLQIRGALWMQRGTRFDPRFLDALARDFETGVRVTDFRSDPGSSHRAVTRWLGPTPPTLDAVTQSTEMLAASSFTIRAPWEVLFEAAPTATGGSMMRVGYTTAVSVARGKDWEAVSIPYLGRDLSMVIITPVTGELSRLEDSMDPALLREVISSMEPATVDLTVPRFSVQTPLDMAPPLVAMGAGGVFSKDQASFPMITGDVALAMSGAYTTAGISADEQGSGAAAATVIRPSEPPRRQANVIRIDQPFIIMVVDEATGALLMLGRIGDQA